MARNQPGTLTPISDLSSHLQATAGRIDQLLGQFFPLTGSTPFPDQDGNVRAEDATAGGSARPDYRKHLQSAVSLASRVVQDFSAQATHAGLSMLGARSLTSVAFDALRRPLRARNRQLLAARILPPTAPEVPAQPEAIAEALAFRLWHVHAWILELRLAIELSSHPATPADLDIVDDLEAHLAALVQPGATWLSTTIDVGSEAATVATYAPATTVRVRNLTWPADLGANLPHDVDPMAVAHQVDADNLHADMTGCWVSAGAHYVRVPANAHILDNLATSVANDQAAPGRRHSWAGNGGTTDAYLSARL